MPSSPRGSENALMSQKRGKDTGEWNCGLLFCHWTDLHQQAEDSIKSCIIHAILQSTHSLWMLFCEVLNALTFQPCLTFFQCWSAMGGGEAHSLTLNCWAKSVLSQCCDSCTKWKRNRMGAGEREISHLLPAYCVPDANLGVYIFILFN